MHPELPFPALSGVMTPGLSTSRLLWTAFIVVLCLLAVAVVIYMLQNRRRQQAEEAERKRLSAALEQSRKRQKAAEKKLSEESSERQKAETELVAVRSQLARSPEPELISEAEESAPAPDASPAPEDKKRAFLATTAVLVGSDYEQVSIIDLASDSFEVLGAERSGELTAGEISYSEASRSFAEGSCVPGDRERVLWLTSVQGLREQLGDREYFELTADVSEQGQTRRKIMRFTRFDEAGNLLLATRRDVTDMIEREARGQSAMAAALLDSESESKAKSELVSSVSRSVSEKLEEVVVLSATAAEESGDEKLKDAFQAIRTGSSAVSEMLSGVLDVLELEDGRRAAENAAVSTSDFLSAAEQRAQSMAKARAVRYTLRRGGAVPKSLVFDEGRALRILSCILAFFMARLPEDAELCHTVTFSAPANARVFMRHRFSDNGPAMSAEALASAFEPSSGGMELYIAKHLAEALDGSLGMESGEGVSITLTLPTREG